MKKLIFKILVVTLILIVASCTFPFTKEAPLISDKGSNIVKTLVPEVVEVFTEVPVPVTGETESPPAATEAPLAIIHSTMPGDPSYSLGQYITDCNTGERITLGATTLIGVDCDNWYRAFFERPADQPDGSYFPSVDILNMQVGDDDNWIYSRIALYQTAVGNLPADLVVGVEVDTDLDSRGEFLILASEFTSSEWTTERVQVWHDDNGDVGGNAPQEPDEAQGDGYEILVFDSGIGDDPDLAWARIDPTDGARVEFAFKATLVPANRIFAWWGWSVLAVFDPAQMEIVDYLEDSTAWKVDNTCGWIFNAKPTDILKNICPFVIPTATPTVTPTPQESTSQCPPGQIWYCYVFGSTTVCGCVAL